ncbi:hypothetical protein MMC11_007118 [Xylographa trunciseda]|nr:hypothetical protein [Xylographa trunciseda]
MDTEELASLTEQLDDDIDDLEDALGPLITGALSDTAQRLPLLDRAKLYALTTYSLESIFFSYVRLNGTNAKEHPVFRELTRVKQYFDKIKVVEFGEPKRENMSLDKPAVRRFIKHDLAGNAELDKVKGQMQPKTNTRLETYRVPLKQKRKIEKLKESSSSLDESSNSDPDIQHAESVDHKKFKNAASGGTDVHERKVSSHLAVDSQGRDSITIINGTKSVIKDYDQALLSPRKRISSTKSRKKRSPARADG